MSKRKEQNYKHVENAISITLHSLDGSTIPAEASKEAEKIVEEIAQRYGLLINIART